LKRDIAYIIVIIALLVVALSYSGLIPLYIPLPLMPKPTEVVKTIFIPKKTVTMIKTISMKPTTVTQVSIVRANVTTTVTQTQLKVETVYKTLILTETKVLSTTYLITKTVEKTVTVTEYPKEILKRNITMFLVPGDEILLGLSNVSTKVIKRSAFLFLSFSDYDLNIDSISCEGAICFIDEKSLDYLGKSLKAEFNSDSIKIELIPKNPMNISKGLIFIHLFIPETENYATRINNKTLEALIEDPIIKSPIIKIDMSYFTDAAYKVRAKPIEISRIGFGWYAIAFKVEGLNVTKLSLNIRRNVLFIKYIMMDKVIAVPEDRSNVIIHLAPPVMTLLNIIKSTNMTCSESICTHTVPSKWVILIKDNDEVTIYDANLKVNYSITLTKDGKILAVMPPAEEITLNIDINMLKYIRTIPGFIHITLYFNPEVQ